MYGLETSCVPFFLLISLKFGILGKGGEVYFQTKKVLRNGVLNDEKSSKMAVTVFGIFRSDYV